MRALFGDIDLILVPALTTPPPPAGALIEQAAADPDFVPRRWAYTLPFNVSGSPTITFPVGFTHGLPLAAQLVAPHFSESLLLRAAYAFQRSTDWHLRQPPCR
jgi:amidase